MASNKGLQSPCESHDSLSTQLTNKSRLWTWKKGWWQSNRHNALQLRPKTALVDYEPELLSHLSLCHDLRTRWGQPGTFLQPVGTFCAKTVALTISPGFQPWIFAGTNFAVHFTPRPPKPWSRIHYYHRWASSWSKVLRNVYSLDESHYLFGGVNISLSWYTSHLCCGQHHQAILPRKPTRHRLTSPQSDEEQTYRTVALKPSDWQTTRPTGLWPKTPSKWRIATELSQQSNGWQSYQILDTFSRGYQINCPTWCRTSTDSSGSEDLNSFVGLRRELIIPTAFRATWRHWKHTTNPQQISWTCWICSSNVMCIYWILLVSLQFNLGLISEECVFFHRKKSAKNTFFNPRLCTLRSHQCI